ncbi:hypothetical protein NF716_00955 [Lactococcus formosensis]|uniref:hypothetical protein n=1 Tax=Lactococcus formosensis TaxID=1281486 RepID=UPI002435758B|nr:hypothetical protein [Lactococcus formosensis]MDG6154932.1 hypothetical protein [Lactococcus formosensis]
MQIFFRTEETNLVLVNNRTQVVELRGLTVDEVEATIKFYNGLKAARELDESENEVVE